MYILRFLGVVFAYIITFTVAKLSHIAILDMMLMVSFILIVDNLMVRMIQRQMMTIYVDGIINNIKKEDNEPRDEE